MIFDKLFSLLNDDDDDSAEAFITAACVSNIGKRRSNNEDNFYFNGQYLDCDNNGSEEILSCDLDLNASEGSFFAVFDGMGGGDYGENASFAAAEFANECFGQEDYIDMHDVGRSLYEFCLEANVEVYKAGQELFTDHMGSTLAAMYFTAFGAWVCNIGDSRCYGFRDGILDQISIDHTDEKEMIKHGITGRKPYLTQHLGIDPEEFRIEPFCSEIDPEAGDRFIIASDGLSDMVSLSEMEKILTDYAEPAEAVEKLLATALDNGGRDNVSIIVINYN